MDRAAFHRNNQLIIQLIPQDLTGVTLHLKSAHLTETQKIYHNDWGVYPSAVSTGNQLPAMAVDDVLASLDLELVDLLEFGEKDLEYFDFVLESKNKRVTVWVDSSCKESPFVWVVRVQKITAENTLVLLNTPQGDRIWTSQQSILLSCWYWDITLGILATAAHIYFAEN